MPFFMIRNDITKVRADAIVNPANEELLEGSGTSRAIYLAAGEEKLDKACRKIGRCELGKAAATPAFRLTAQYIFHAVGPVWINGERGEEEILYHTYMETLRLAEDYRLDSIAFPLLSAGNYGFPKEIAMRTAVRAISEFLMDHEMTIYLVLYDQDSFAISRKLSESIEAYIDDHYVEENDERIPGDEDYPETAKEEFRMKLDNIPVTASMPRPQRAAQRIEQRADQEVQMNFLEQLLRKKEETFSQALLRMIDERGLKDSYVYKKANIDRRHFSKIRNHPDYTPNKKTVIAFAVALELSLEETNDLLMKAGYAFYIVNVLLLEAGKLRFQQVAVSLVPDIGFEGGQGVAAPEAAFHFLHHLEGIIVRNFIMFPIRRQVKHHTYLQLSSAPCSGALLFLFVYTISRIYE